ncbi:hypothetical protein OKW21_002615 [Catalinimonas alkaloidigena]|nr:hypothetical protein [Catalinimonas alkaloidigena]
MISKKLTGIPLTIYGDNSNGKKVLFDPIVSSTPVLSFQIFSISIPVAYSRPVDSITGLMYQYVHTRLICYSPAKTLFSVINLSSKLNKDKTQVLNLIKYSNKL